VQALGRPRMVAQTKGILARRTCQEQAAVGQPMGGMATPGVAPGQGWEDTSGQSLARLGQSLARCNGCIRLVGEAVHPAG
jgi:hypothetical protein